MTYHLPPNHRYRPEPYGKNLWLIRDVTRQEHERAHLLLEDLATSEKQALRDCRIANNAFDEGVKAAVEAMSESLDEAAKHLDTRRACSRSPTLARR